jgi:hypothetical protein
MALPTDVISKIIEANPIRQGDSVCGVTNRGDYETLRTTKNKYPSLDDVNDKYKDKFTGTDTYSS